MQAINPKKPSHPRRVKRSNNKIIKKLNMITGQIRIIRVITMNKVTMCGTTIWQENISMSSQITTTTVAMTRRTTSNSKKQTTEMLTQTKTCMTKATTIITQKETSTSSTTTKSNTTTPKTQHKHSKKLLLITLTLITTNKSLRSSNSQATSTKTIFTLRTNLSTTCLTSIFQDNPNSSRHTAHISRITANKKISLTLECKTLRISLTSQTKTAQRN